MGTGATLQLEGGLLLAEALTLNGGTVESLSGTNLLNAPINLNAASTLQVDVGQLAINGQISGTADLTKAGGGTLTLNVSNTFTGQLNVNSGIVQGGSIVGTISNTGTTTPITAAGPSVFGAVTGSVLVASGATLQLNPGAGTTYIGKQLILNGTGLGLFFSGLLLPIGALQNAPINSVSNTWTGNIVLNNDATISAAVNNLTVTGAISGAGALTKVGASTLVLAAADSYGGATTVTRAP